METQQMDRLQFARLVLVSFYLSCLTSSRLVSAFLVFESIVVNFACAR